MQSFFKSATNLVSEKVEKAKNIIHNTVTNAAHGSEQNQNSIPDQEEFILLDKNKCYDKEKKLKLNIHQSQNKKNFTIINHIQQNKDSKISHEPIISKQKNNKQDNEQDNKFEHSIFEGLILELNSDNEVIYHVNENDLDDLNGSIYKISFDDFDGSI